MNRLQQLPRPALRLLGITVVAATAAVGARIPEVLRWRLVDLLFFMSLSLATILTEQFQISFRHETETENFSLTDALWVPGLVRASPGVLTMAVLVGTLAGQRLRQWAPFKIAFNVAQFIVAVTVAEVVFAAVSSGGANRAAWIGTVVGMSAFFVVNESLVSIMIGLVEGRPVRALLLLPEGLNVLHWATNVTLGLLGTLLWDREPRALPLLIAPIVLTYLVYRAWSRSRRRAEEKAETERNRALFDAGRALFGPLDAALEFREFLRHVAVVVDAEAVEVVVAEGDRITMHGSWHAEPRVVHRASSLDLAELVQAWDGLSMTLAPIGDPDERRGVLAVHRQQPLSPAEVSLLETLASQVGVKLDNRKLLHEALEQRARLADVIGHSSDGIALLGPDGLVQSWNRAMERITGHREHEVAGRSWGDVIGPGEDTVGGSRHDGERDALMVRRDGARRWIRYTGTPIPDRNGSVTGHVVVARDVTAELEAERLKSDFVAMVSHELRTPLTPLKGFLTMLDGDEVPDSPEVRREYYPIMLRQANRLESLINDLLDVSRIDTGMLTADIRPIELTEVVEEQVRESAQGQPRGRLRLFRPSDPVLVAADPLRVRQVVANLVSNALKYSDLVSPVEVTVEIGERQAIVSVLDHGPGIDLADQSRVFERFQRVESSGTQRAGGTGIGLYIARHLIEAMDGRLWLDSRPGEGSTFSFSLPLARSSGAEPGGVEDGSQTGLPGGLEMPIVTR